MIFNQYFSFKDFRKMPLLKYDEGNETIYQNQNCRPKGRLAKAYKQHFILCPLVQ